MTLKEVAKLANVSVSTASKALKNSFDVSEETRNLVLSVAVKSGYLTEKKKTVLENRKAERLTLAAVVPEIISPYYSLMVESLTSVASEKGCKTVVYSVGFDNRDVVEAVRSAAGDESIDAVVCFSKIGEKIESGIPIFTTSNEDSDIYSKINIDLESSIKALSEEYKGKKVCFVGEPLTEGKRDLCLKYIKGVTSHIGIGRYEKSGADAANKIISEKELPDLIICAYDEIAYGLTVTLKEKGIRVPNDIEVMGINDIRTSSWFEGGLSTIGFDTDMAFGEIIKDIMTDAKNKKVISRTYKVPSKIIKRNTTK